MNEKMSIGIVGGGQGGLELLNLFKNSQKVEIKFIVDVNLESVGIKEAKKIGIPISNKLEECLTQYELDYVFEATGVLKVMEQIKRHVDEGKIASSSVAFLLINILKENQSNTLTLVLNKLGKIREEIEHNAKRVKQLVEDFSRLAGTMKILSFNAAIEAVKASSQGKGFGVVAMELKDSSDLAKKISDTIGTINDKSIMAANDISMIVQELSGESQKTT